MQRLISFLLLLLPAVLGAKYDGMFKLVKAEDDHQVDVPIPGDFSIVLRSESESRYALSFRIGNSLRGEMGVENTDGSAKDTISIGPMSSTMMMPPENIFRLEQFLSSNLPKMTSISLADDDKQLIMEGEATVTFERQ